MGRYESLFEEVEVDDWWDADEGDDEDGEGDDDGDVVWALKPGEVDPCVPGSSNTSHGARGAPRCTVHVARHVAWCTLPLMDLERRPWRPRLSSALLPRVTLRCLQVRAQAWSDALALRPSGRQRFPLRPYSHLRRFPLRPYSHLRRIPTCSATLR